MKPMSFALVAAVALAVAAQAQTATPPASTPATSAPAAGKHPLSHDCKEEVKKVCGRAHGEEMENCVKSSLDLNKFSAACKTQLTHAAKPSG
jgi:curli biogenesis system outer membrane secretion channel CsgG